MKSLATSLFLALSAPAYAGDACPVGVTIVDLGVPAWLDRDEILSGLTSARTRMGIRYEFGADGSTVTSVFPDGPAEAAGLQVGDLIRTIGGIAVGPEGTIHAVADDAEPGDTVELQITREGRDLKPNLTFGGTDPVPRALANAGSKGECRYSDARIATDAERSQITPQLTDANRAFRCDDAHVDLIGADSGDLVYFLRGSRRVLITFPDWGTVCVSSQALDGASLASGAEDVLVPLIADYAEDRFANP